MPNDIVDVRWVMEKIEVIFHEMIADVGPAPMDLEKSEVIVLRSRMTSGNVV